MSFCIIIPCVTDFCNSSLPNVVHVFVFVINFCTLKWPKSLSFRGHLNPSARAPETSILVQTGADIESIELSATHLVAAGNKFQHVAPTALLKGQNPGPFKRHPEGSTSVQPSHFSDARCRPPPMRSPFGHPPCWPSLRSYDNPPHGLRVFIQCLTMALMI